MRRILAALAAILAAALTLSACGEMTDRIQPDPSQTESLSVELDRAPNADHVGLYEAMANGDFRRAGLDVDVRSATEPQTPLAQVEHGKVDVAITAEPQLMLARNQGATVLAFGAIVQRPQTSLIALGSRHIHGVASLRGKKLGTTGQPYQRALLRTVLAHAHVPQSSVTQVDVGSDLIPAMTSGRVDATLGGFSNDEAIALRAAHKHPTVIPVSKSGVPNYDELVLVTNEVFFADHTTELRRFVQALGRGYAAVRADPAAGVKALDAANPSLNPTLEAAAVKASLPDFSPGDGHPFGWQDQAQWNAFGRWMTRHHLIGGPRAWYEDSTNQLLAGQGP